MLNKSAILSVFNFDLLEKKQYENLVEEIELEVDDLSVTGSE